MNISQARNFIHDIFSESFDKEKYRLFIRNLLNEFDESDDRHTIWSHQYVKDAYKPGIDRFERLATYTDENGDKIDILIVYLKQETGIHRARTFQRNFIADYLTRGHGDNKEAVLTAFVSPYSSDWRFSLIRLEYVTEQNEKGIVAAREKLTPARRYSFLVGSNESSHTAQSQLVGILSDTDNNPTLAKIEEAFNVERVTKEFFESYKTLVFNLQEELRRIIKKDKVVAAEFKTKKINTLDFAKKLMGQIVFLYFIQKKGWLGVKKGEDWGTGPHNFLRCLFTDKVKVTQAFLPVGSRSQTGMSVSPSERTPYHFKRHAIQNCLYGVDIDPGAVEIAKLRLWLSLVVDEDLSAPCQPYYAYAILCENDSVYIGYTEDLARRWNDHQKGKASWTAKYKPIEIIHYEVYSTQDEAIAREKWFKTGFGRKWIRRERKAGRLRAWNKDAARQAGDIRQIKPLPNLDYKIVAGNSLLGVEKDLFNWDAYNRLEKLKPRFFDETDHDKKADIKADIDALIHELTKGKDVFDYEIYFSEVFHKNKGFDVVIANPPYIFSRESTKKGITDTDKKYYYANYQLAEYQVNLYPLFIEKGTRILRSSGCLCFITPNNWLTINTNKTMRKFILGRSDLTIVNFYAQVFESASVDSAIIVYRKDASNPQVKLFEYTDGFSFIKDAHCDFFLKQRDCIINIETFKVGGMAELVQRIESISIRLGDVADVKSGLVAYEEGKGTPPQTHIMKQQRAYHSTKKIDTSYFMYLDGQDVCRYHMTWGGQWLKYGANLAAPRKNFRLYSTERILVRQIPAKPPYCILACLTDKTILNDRNSMNIINIRETPEYVLGVLNSRLVSWWFVHKFGKMQRKTFPQFKVNELADFPLPKNGERHRDAIAKCASEILVAKKGNPSADTTVPEQEIDRLVYELYELTEDEIAHIEESLANTGR